ncbi:YdaS family helix-turn-helix protein [Paraburkholderia tuberum]
MDAVRVAGTQESVAAMAGKKQGHFSKWLRSPLGVPAEHCMAIEEGCLSIDPNCNVTCERLRPDLTAQWQYMRNSAPVSSSACCGAPGSPPIPLAAREAARGELGQPIPAPEEV